MMGFQSCKAGLGIAVVSGLLWAGSASASISYSTPGGAYTQDFDTLPNTPTNTNIQTSAYTTGWTDDDPAGVVTGTSVSIPGWYLWHPTSATEGGANGHQRMRFGSGTSGTGAFYSFGTNSTTDRALGTMPSATMATTGDSMRIGLRLTNNTGVPLTTFTVIYDGEQWRDGNDEADEISLSYLRDSDLAVGDTWHDAGAAAAFAPAGTFTPPVQGSATSTTVDGNVAGLVSNITATVDLSATPWQPGTDLWLRWSEIELGGSGFDNDGLGIDNVRFSADVPEPASVGLLALAGLGLLSRRRRA